MIWAVIGAFIAGMAASAALLLLWCIIRSGGGAAEGPYSDAGPSPVGLGGDAGDRRETAAQGRSRGRGVRES